MKHVYANCMLPIFLILATLFTSCGTTDPEDNTNYSNKILFTSSRSGKEQLYMMNPDGSDIKQITSGEFSHGGGRWSPDAKRILANTDENLTTAGAKMVIMNSDGSNRRLLEIGSQMAWSPNDELFLFWACPSCEFGIFESALFIIDTDGKNASRLPVDGGNPDWSPNGNYIIFNAVDSVNTQATLSIIGYPNYNLIKSIGPSGAGYPAWSPNETNIAFTLTIKGYSEICVVDSANTNIQQVTNHSTMEHYIYPRWSTDGSKIIFIAFSTDGSQRKHIYMVNKDGSDLHKVIDDDTVTSCDWS